MEKKFNFTTLRLASLMASLLVLCTSCMDDDTRESMDLSGQWTGDFGMYYNYEYRGKVYTFDSYDTDIVFYPDYNYATHGYGYEVDYYEYGPYEKMSLRFNWEINRGIIYLDYPGYSEYSTQIRDYYLTDEHFTGYFVNSTGRFSLRKLTDYYDWGYYAGYGDFYYWGVDWPTYDWGVDWLNYTRSTNAADSVQTDNSAGKIVGLGNRYAKKTSNR